MSADSTTVSRSEAPANRQKRAQLDALLCRHLRAGHYGTATFEVTVKDGVALEIKETTVEIHR
jgi:hypothetical protein